MIGLKIYISLSLHRESKEEFDFCLDSDAYNDSKEFAKWGAVSDIVCENYKLASLLLFVIVRTKQN